MSDCKTQNYALTHTHARARTHPRVNTCKCFAEIAEKRPPDADDAQQQKEHNFTAIYMHIHKSAAEINVVAVPR